MPAAMSPPTPTLALHYHPLSSCCHKVLIALDELGMTAELRLLNFGDAAERAVFGALSPMGKMPLLEDHGQYLPETSIIIEHLQNTPAAAGRRLIPQDADEALQVRLWDRLFDFYVMTPMQAHTADLMRAPAERDATGVARARDTLLMAYAMLDRQVAGRSWAASEHFSMADCAAAPALFYAVAYVPVPPAHVHLAAYLERLMIRPSVARTVDQARPFLKYFPGRQGLARRYFDPDAA